MQNVLNQPQCVSAVTYLYVIVKANDFVVFNNACYMFGAIFHVKARIYLI